MRACTTKWFTVFGARLASRRGDDVALVGGEGDLELGVGIDLEGGGAGHGDLRYRPCLNPSTPASARELCDLFEELGPDAPTLCEGWTTIDLAAHLVVRERDPRAAPGILLGGPLRARPRAADGAGQGPGLPTAWWTGCATARRSGPFAVPGLRTLMNLNEYVVHHEDVRRANGLAPRDRPAPTCRTRCGALVRRRARLMLRKVRGAVGPTGAVRPERRRSWRQGPEVVAHRRAGRAAALPVRPPGRRGRGRDHRRPRAARGRCSSPRALRRSERLSWRRRCRGRARPVRPSQRTAKSTSVARSSPESR